MLKCICPCLILVLISEVIMQINTVYKDESWQLAFDLRQKYHRLSIAKAPLSRCHVNNKKIDRVQSWGAGTGGSLKSI